MAELTRQATNEINGKITEVGVQIDGTVERITALSLRVIEAGKQVHQVRGAMETVAASVTEQTAAVQEVAHNATLAAKGTEEAAKTVALILAASRDARSKVH